MLPKIAAIQLEAALIQAFEGRGAAKQVVLPGRCGPSGSDTGGFEVEDHGRQQRRGRGPRRNHRPWRGDSDHSAASAPGRARRRRAAQGRERKRDLDRDRQARELRQRAKTASRSAPTRQHRREATRRQACATMCGISQSEPADDADEADTGRGHQRRRTMSSRRTRGQLIPHGEGLVSPAARCSPARRGRQHQPGQGDRAPPRPAACTGLMRCRPPSRQKVMVGS